MVNRSEAFTYKVGTVVKGKIRPTAPKDAFVSEISKRLGKKLLTPPEEVDKDTFFRNSPITGIGTKSIHFERHDLHPLRIQPNDVIEIYTQKNPNEWLHTDEGKKILDTIVEETKPLDRRYDIVVFSLVGTVGSL